MAFSLHRTSPIRSDAIHTLRIHFHPGTIAPTREVALRWIDPTEQTATQIEDLRSCLTESERQQSQRYHRTEDRSNFIIGRATVRQHFAKSSTQRPADIQLERGAYGKLEVADNHDFNIAHTAGCVALAFAKTASVAVGIDVEPLYRPVDYDLLAAYAFSVAEQAWMHRQFDRRRAFFQLWTAKEAVLKAAGCGLLDELPALCLCSPKTSIGTNKDRRWQLLTGRSVEVWSWTDQNFSYALALSTPRTSTL